MKENYTLAKWLSGEMTDVELAEFKNNSDYSIYEKIKNYSAQITTPSFDEEKILATIIATPKKEVKVIPMNYSWILKIAASFVLLLGLTFTYLNYATTTQTALYANQTTFQLPDNSEVVLNAGSDIEYKKWNWDNNRKLNLNGEAYFKVAKGEKFEVETPLGKVTVLGTQFNVKARKNRFDVTCYEGKVKVNYQNTETIITKGQRVSFANGNAIQVQQNKVTKPEWTNGELAFEKETLNNIISELNRQYDVTIELKNVNSNQLFSGSIPAKNLDSALQIIASTYHLQSKKMNTKIILEAVDDKM